jgi:hypothetical protein
MSGQGSEVRRTRSAAREEFLKRAEELWESFNEWHEDHPDASFDEMEEEIGRQRRAVLGQFLELNLRQGDLGASPEAPECRQCGQPMVFKGYRRKSVQGLESETEIPRAYYHCSSCQVGFFPPGSAFAAAEGQLE